MPCSKKNQVILHRASWVLPICSPPLRDGIVATQGGKILEVGTAKSIKQNYAGNGYCLLDHGDGVILPSLVNTHTHLELSCLAGKVDHGDNFVAWIKNLIRAREKSNPQQVEEGILSSIKELRQRGTGLIGDISNTGSSILPLRNSALAGRVFLEAIGFQQQKEIKNKEIIQAILSSYPLSDKGVQLSLAAHAPYTVSAAYFQFLPKNPLWPKQPFSIHVAESREESNFLLTGDGDIRLLLTERRGWNPAWSAPQTTSVQYLFQQGMLRPETICVHAVWVNDEDIEILSRTHSQVCLCPRSNRNLGQKLAPVEKFLQRAIPVSMGTDSLASNSSLCLWQEMSFLKKAIPSLPCSQILKMVTLSGAMALGAKNFGSIEAGKSASLIFLPLLASSASKIEEILVLEGLKKKIRWINNLNLNNEEAG